MLSKELLEILCCPKCRGDLRYDAEKSSLECVRCKTVYPVKDDIPVLLPDLPSPEDH